MMTADNQNNHRFKIIHSFGLPAGDTEIGTDQFRPTAEHWNWRLKRTKLKIFLNLELPTIILLIFKCRIHFIISSWFLYNILGWNISLETFIKHITLNRCVIIKPPHTKIRLKVFCCCLLFVMTTTNFRQAVFAWCCSYIINNSAIIWQTVFLAVILLIKTPNRLIEQDLHIAYMYRQYSKPIARHFASASTEKPKGVIITNSTAVHKVKLQLKYSTTFPNNKTFLLHFCGIYRVANFFK